MFKIRHAALIVRVALVAVRSALSQISVTVHSRKDTLGSHCLKVEAKISDSQS